MLDYENNPAVDEPPTIKKLTGWKDLYRLRIKGLPSYLSC